MSLRGSAAAAAAAAGGGALPARKENEINLEEKPGANNPVTSHTDTFHAADVRHSRHGLQAEDKVGDRVGTILEHVVVRQWVYQ